MKKFTVCTLVLIALMFVTVPASAGPIDWLFEKMGYTPTSQYDQQVVIAQQALAAAAASQEVAKQLASTATFQESVIKYGSLGVLVIGGLAFFRRKDLAQRVLDEKKKV